MRAKYKARRAQFERECHALLLALGAVPIKTVWQWPYYELTTRAGRLVLAVHTDLWLIADPVFQGGGSPWVSTRFDNVQRARELVDCNDYTGKWNFHLWRNWTDDFAPGLAVLERDLRRVTNAKLVTA